MKLDFSKVKVEAIDGTFLPDVKVNELVGNLIYNFTKDLGMLNLAQRIYQGGEVELRESDVAEIKRLLNIPQCNFLAFTKKAVLDFLEGK